jgi:hypothetical protein
MDTAKEASRTGGRGRIMVGKPLGTRHLSASKDPETIPGGRTFVVRTVIGLKMFLVDSTVA